MNRCRAKFGILACGLLALHAAPAGANPTASDLNHGLGVEVDALNDVSTLSWWGVTGETYFIQVTPDLTAGWEYIDYIYPGADDVLAHGFAVNTDAFFYRLKYTDEPTIDPWNDDFDGDNIGNQDELHQDTDPFAFDDLNANGIPDDWESFWDDQFAVFPKPVKVELTRGQVATKTLYLNNPVAPDADFTVTVSNNLAEAQFAYNYEDNLSGESIYNWTEISATGTLLTEISDAVDGYEEIALSNFTFPFYGTGYSSVFVSSNGMLAFGGGTSAYSNLSAPSTSVPNNFVAPFWEDHDTSTAGEIYVQELNDRLIVQYEAVAPYSGTGSYTYQAVLHSSGLIDFFYKEMVGDVESATIGLENADGTDGLQIAHNEPYIQDGLAVSISQGSAYFVEVSPLSGTATLGGFSSLAVDFRPFELEPGTYQADIEIAHTGTGTTPWTVPAILELTNPPSQIHLTAPDDGFTMWGDESITLRATATDEDFEIERVEFFADESKQGEDLTGPSYAYTWQQPAPGVYSLTARVVDRLDTVTISDPITVTVLEDTDLDRMEDNWEIVHGLDPLINDAAGDADGDGLSNIWEFNHDFNPTDASDSSRDTSGNGIPDWWEITHFGAFGNVLASGDADNDIVSNLEEYQSGTDPNNWDSDGDLMSDDWEISYNLNPLDSSGANGADGDSDVDGLSNFQEMIHGSDPGITDSDGDGTSDGDEVNQGSDPNNSGDGGQPPPAEEMVDVPFSVGDPSYSHSERWRMNIQGNGPDDTRQFGLVSPNFGQVHTQNVKLRRGNNYTITVSHLATNEEDGPDYDWQAQVDSQPVTEVLAGSETHAQENRFTVIKETWILDNEDGLMGKVNQSFNSTNHASGKVAKLLKVELDINETPETADDLVRETNIVSSVSYRDWVKCKLHLDPSIGIDTFHLSDPDGKVGFFKKAAESNDDPDNETAPSTSLTLNLDSSGNAFFFITGSSRSSELEDASIQLRKDDENGLLLLEKNLTVYYFDEVDLEISHGGNPYTLGQATATTNAFTYSSRLATEFPDRVNYAAEARIRPDGLDCNNDALKNLRIGIAQNAVSLRKVYWNNPSLSSPASVTVPSTVAKEWTTGSTWLSDGTTLTAPLYDKINSDGSSTSDTIDARCLQVPKGCNPNPIAAQTYDTPGLSDRVFVDIDTSVQGVSARYELSEVQLIISFRTWTVLYDYDSNEIVPLRQRDWSVNSFSSVNDITWSDPRMDATEGNTPQIDGNHAAPSDLPVTDPPFFNQTLFEAWGDNFPYQGTVQIVPHGNNTTTFQE